MIVVDVGSVTHGLMNSLDESIRPLIRRFKPDVYFGFDIYPGMLDGETEINGAKCIFARRAAWVEEGVLGVVEQGNCTHIVEGDLNGCKDFVPTFDLGGFLSLLPDGFVLKLDVEGAEYPLAWDLHERGIDKRIGLLLIEWHPPETANGWDRLGQAPLECPTEEWG